MDPMVVHLGATIACTTLGWLIGPTLGTSLWNLLNRSRSAQLALRDKEFYNHIRRMRADPTRQMAHNPSPDYYVR